ncbi:TlpA family protein disulfide reductase [Niabella sp. W65]|nr:TlpA family protein disulfide reductase [Niabella sp. W65]MCH7363162.1 TlpA family protein disulfide reductase [Niabella sp. W65]
MQTKSVLNTQSGTYVLTLNNDEVKRIAVNEGIRLDTLTEVFGNLSPEDKIIIKPSEEIKEGKTEPASSSKIINSQKNKDMKIRLNKRAMLTYVLIIMTGFCFAACNNNNKNEKAEQPVLNAIAEEATTSLPEQTSNDVLFKDKDGKTVSLKSLKGKVVFINFWATWCPPCIHEMPSINKLKQSFKGKNDIVFLMVDVDNKIEKSTAFMQKNKYDLPVYVPAGDIPPDYLGGSIPTTIILDKSGNMIARIEGGRDYTSPEIVKALNELVESN